MTELENSAPAGDEPVVTPVETGNTETVPPEGYSLEEAAQRWDAAQDEPKEPAQSDAAAEQNSQTEPAGDPEGEAANAEGEDNGEPVEAGEPDNPDGEDPSAFDIDKLHGNTKLRLRDGTEWTVAEVKKRLDDLRTVEQRQQEFEKFVESKRPELQGLTEKQTTLAQREQFLSQYLEPAIKVLVANEPVIPPLPPRELLAQNAMEYWEKKAEHDEKVEAHRQWQGHRAHLQREAERHQQARVQEQEKAQAAFFAKQREYLLDRRPELADTKKAEEFVSLITDVGKQYGFAENEVRGEADGRLLHMIADLAHKARQWDALQANPPKPVRPTSNPTAPVAQPGRRVAPAEQAAGKKQELIAKARNNGRGVSLEELARLMDQSSS